MNISSNSDWSLLWDAKILRTQEKLWRYSNYKSSNFLDCSKVRSAKFPNFILLRNSKNRGHIIFMGTYATKNPPKIRD